MDSSTSVEPARGLRPAVVVAAAASAAAGLVHVGAVRTHEGDSVLALLFMLCAMGQLLWAVAVAVRPIRPVLLAGVVINGGAVLFWAVSRTVGVGFIDSLAGGEPVGSQDLTAALFAGASAVAAIVVLVRPVVVRRMAPVWSGALAAFALLAAVPAMAAEHTHEDGEHEHVEASGHEHGAIEVAAGHESADHAHGSGDGEEASADHAHDAADPSHEDHATDGGSESTHAHDTTSGSGAHGDHTGTTGTDGHDHTGTTDGSHSHPPTTDGTHNHPTTTTIPGTSPTGPIISLDDPRLTTAQRAAAQALIDSTTAGMAPYTSEAAVVAAGYTSLGDGGATGYEHFVRWSYLGDPYELDPAHIESIVLKKNGDGTKTVVSAMYILSLGKTMNDTPDIAGELTSWHYHDNLCLQGTKLVGLAVNGVCTVGTLVVTPPMMHVWMVENPCGPFSGIDEHGVQCGTHEH